MECDAVRCELTVEIILILNFWQKLRFKPTVVEMFLRLIDCLIVWLIDRLIDWLIDRLIDWSIDRLIDWSIDWLVDWMLFTRGYDTDVLKSRPYLRQKCPNTQCGCAWKRSVSLWNRSLISICLMRLILTAHFQFTFVSDFFLRIPPVFLFYLEMWCSFFRMNTLEHVFSLSFTLLVWFVNQLYYSATFCQCCCACSDERRTETPYPSCPPGSGASYWASPASIERSEWRRTMGHGRGEWCRLQRWSKAHTRERGDRSGLFDWLIDWSIDPLTAWLIDWLIDVIEICLKCSLDFIYLPVC